MSLNKNTVIKIANLSKIDIRDSEIEELTCDLNKIVSWIEQLNEVDIENVLPMTSVSGMYLRERDDEVKDGGYPEEIVKNSKFKKENSFSVPKVIE